MPSRVRILIADDHTLVAELCQNLLEPEFEVVGLVNDGQALVHAAASLRPSMIIVDIAMPVLNGLDATAQVKEVFPNVKVIFLTMNEDSEIAAEAFRRGASGYLLKSCASQELARAVREVMRGKTYMSSTLPRDTINFLRHRDETLVEGHRLTPRQREVLQLVAQGKGAKEIGRLLHMTPRTASFHKYRMMDVLGAKSTADVVRYAVRQHLLAA
jgi:DNA-binding NarL/FixJ family response regulator